MTVLGNIPTDFDNEQAQFQRVLDILQSQLQSHEPCVLVLNVDYVHKAGKRISNDKDWKGQIDILLLRKNRIVIYELKSKRVRLLWGRSDQNPWKLQYMESGQIKTERSYFDQVSKQRQDLLRHFLNDFKERHGFSEDFRFVVDARLVFLPESDLSGFYYKIDKTQKKLEFQEEILAKIEDDNDLAFVRNSFEQAPWAEEELRLKRHLNREHLRSLELVYEKWQLPKKTEKWFSVITEEDLPADLSASGYDSFDLSPDEMHLIGKELINQGVAASDRYET
jgi:hypothetical protein